MASETETGPAAAAGRPDAEAEAETRFEAFVSQARRGPSGAWRPLAMVGLVIAGQLAMLTLIAAVVGQATGRPLSLQEGETQLLVALASLATTPPLLALGLRALHGRPFASLIDQDRKRRRRELALGAAGAVALTVMGLSLAAALGLVSLSWSEAPTPALWVLGAAFVLIPLQASGEELLFRGYLLQEICRRAPFALAWAAAPSAVFALLHYDPGAPADEALSYALSSFMFGVLAAALVWRSGSLSAAIGLHVMNNWIALLLFEPAQGISGLGPIALRLAEGGAYAALALDAVLLLAIYGAFSAAFARGAKGRAP